MLTYVILISSISRFQEINQQVKMIRALVVCALVVAACSLPFVDKFDRSYDEDWELYKKVFLEIF